MGLPDGGRSLLEGPVYHSAQWAFSFLPLLGGNSVVMRHKFDAAETLELIDRRDRRPNPAPERSLGLLPVPGRRPKKPSDCP